MRERVQRKGTDTGPDVRHEHIKNFGREAASGTHSRKACGIMHHDGAFIEVGIAHGFWI